VLLWGGSLWVANFGNNNVMKLTTGGVVTGTFKAGDGPVSAVFSEGVVYVVNNGGDSVTKLNASDGANLGSISVGRSPIGVAVSGSSVWVTNSGSNSVSKR
jgi:YVTN family beta-propeller protein